MVDLRGSGIEFVATFGDLERRGYKLCGIVMRKADQVAIVTDDAKVVWLPASVLPSASAEGGGSNA